VPSRYERGRERVLVAGSERGTRGTGSATEAANSGGGGGGGGGGS